MGEWIPFGKSWGEFQEQGLNDVGVLIDLDSQLFLLGDINTQGGGCDCCGISNGSVVKRYKVVWREGDE